MNIYKALTALPDVQRIIFTPTEAYAPGDKAVMRLDVNHYGFQIEAPMELPKTLKSLTYHMGAPIALADDNPVAVAPANTIPVEAAFQRPVQDTPARSLETFMTIHKALHGRKARHDLVSIDQGRPTRFTTTILTLLI